ncbi:MAG: hypothetical protein H6577_09485 [Lewinellaceae bacterium]|nr:hypothetical protein [Saprospiraceae bacterium]MCB9338348.1 hypothetical protein [Lewinellaceae bacterium]
MKFYVLIALIFIFFVNPEIYHEHILTFGLVLIAVLFFEFIRGFGIRIHPLDLMGFYAMAAYWVAPALAYHLTEIGWYEGFNFMCIPSEKYFATAVPGTLALLAGINFPFKIAYKNHKEYYEKISDYLKDKTDAGFKLFWIGLGSNLIAPFAPGGLGFFLELSSQLIYIGALYLWFSPMDMSKKLPYLVAMFLMPLARALKGGMFGEVVFWGAFMAMLMLLKFHVAFWKKMVIAVFGVVFILFIQSIKYEFRQMTWYTQETSQQTMGYKAEVFQKLWSDRVADPDLLVGPLMLSNALDRTNQGSLVAMAVRYVPEYEPYANGETIFLATAASFIPRFVWPNKPVVGSREKMIRFTGFDNGEYTAMDIGQLGDAYVNFGPWGGALFMFIYGFLFAFIFAKIFEIAESNMLSLILWVPLFYAGVVQMDGSVLACMNHIIKTGMFTFMAIMAYKKFFGTEL